MLLVGALASIAISAGATAAGAVTAYVTTSLNLRAGPGTNYPAVARMRAGDRVEVYGCLSGWTWCDINWRGYRGWAAGRYLLVAYQNRRAPVYRYGRFLGIPFVSFNVSFYWGQHYRAFPFFAQMRRFGAVDNYRPNNPPRVVNPPPRGPGQDNQPPRAGNQPPRGPGQDNQPPQAGNQPPRGPGQDNQPPQAGYQPPRGAGQDNQPSQVFNPRRDPDQNTAQGPQVTNPGSVVPGNQGCPAGMHRERGRCVR
jgi:uncharacterized protein YraI